ncbi:hypothetical protein OO013_09045 [Mangrovivirga sp. M17]|uniref:RND transporter n=1 Tax=Mangrovivirga halotolerans TaxID=2993936 RepID=A0ABT3RRL2_9BACT|nr:hypothetical protein [Mangrovivirga halotolerans]MCX2744009.1 hypothetical protein [Mangrovivirga halotolerans]
MDTNKIKELILPLILSLTLGLAPFFPEPHLIGKLKWVAGGANGMKLIDWFDLVLHGAPWLLLIITIIRLIIPEKKDAGQTS